LTTATDRRPETLTTPDACEQRHRPLRALTWQLFGAFVMVLVTLALAGAAHLSMKADAEDLERTESRTHDLEAELAVIGARLGEIRAGQESMRENLRYIRERLDKEIGHE